MSSSEQNKYFVSYLGVIFLVFGLFIAVKTVFGGTQYSSEGHLLYNLGLIALGIAFQLLGLGLIVLGKK